MSKALLLMAQGKPDRKYLKVSSPDDLTGQTKLPLHDSGKRRAQRMGLWLARHAYQPDMILASPTLRARVTAEKAIKVMGIGVAHLHVDKRLYKADLPVLLSRMKTLSESAQTVLLVGQRKGLEQLITYLAGEQTGCENQERLLKHGSLAVLKVNDNWASLGAAGSKLCHLIHTSSLSELFPFPDEKGKELRQRPAYYYRQSSVIPYRYNGKNLDVLLVRSSKKRHWIVPKGVHEPGLTSQESAAKEAWEEAGIKGVVAAESLGCYHYEKWGSLCEVSVYPMLVEFVVNEEQWLESHRGRRWCTVDEAKSLLKQQNLIPMLQELLEDLNGGQIAGDPISEVEV